MKRYGETVLGTEGSDEILRDSKELLRESDKVLRGVRRGSDEVLRGIRRGSDEVLRGIRRGSDEALFAHLGSLLKEPCVCLCKALER